MRKVILTFFASTLLLAACSSNAGSSNTSSNLDADSENKVETKGNKMGTIKMTKTDFVTKVHNYEKDMDTWKYLGDKPAIIDFYADWCGPCKQIAPILDELAAEYGDDIYIYKVDVDSEKELASIFGIRSIPSVLFVPMEGQPQMSSGAASKTEFKQMIDQVLLAKEDK